MVLVMDFFLFLLCSFIVKWAGPSTRRSGSWFSLHCSLVNTEKVHLSRNYPSGVAAVLWFICFSASLTMTSAGTVNRRSFKGRANLSHPREGVWGLEEQYTVTVSSQDKISSYFPRHLHLNLSSRCFLLNNNMLESRGKGHFIFKKAVWKYVNSNISQSGCLRTNEAARS